MFYHGYYTDLSHVTDKLYHIMLYTSHWSRFKLTTSVVIGTDCIGCCKSNYHTVRNTRFPISVVCFPSPPIVRCACYSLDPWCPPHCILFFPFMNFSTFLYEATSRTSLLVLRSRPRLVPEKYFPAGFTLRRPNTGGHVRPRIRKTLLHEDMRQMELNRVGASETFCL
jgi:hypothetical protein